MGINPKFGGLHLVTARAYIVKSEYSLQSGQDPEEHLDHARESIRKYMEVSGGTLFANREASIELIAAEWAILQGRPASAFLESAESSLRKALERNSEDSETYRKFAK
jgi:hypothetical protein